MNLKNKRILITGGRGFIGSRLSLKLNNLKAKVDIYDNMNGYDITNETKLKAYVSKKYDIIYHLAGFSGSAISNNQKEKSFKVNSFATANLCELITYISPKTKLVISGTRLEYGKPEYLPVDENHPVKPISIYGISRLIATQTAMAYHIKSKLDVIIFRTSNVYGPHQNTKYVGYNVINNFIDRAKSGDVLPIYGRGNQKRDYIFIDDLIEAFILAGLSDKSGQVYNLGFGKGIQFKKMLELIVKLAGRGIIKYKSWPENLYYVETGSYVSDISKIRNDLGFIPKTDFVQGIKKTIEEN